MTDNRNTILAVILSGLVLIAWQYWYNIPQMEKQRAAQQASQTANPVGTPSTNQPAGTTPTPAPGQQAGAPATQPAAAQAAPIQPRNTVIAASPRVKIDTPSVSGSISLTGARIDDVALVKYRETVDPKSPAIELLSPSGTKEPFYAEFGFVPAAGSSIKMPDRDTVWKQEGSNALTPTSPAVLTLGQWTGPDVQAHDFHRRQVPVHDQGRSHERRQRAGHDVSVRPHLTPRHPACLRLLHPA